MTISVMPIDIFHNVCYNGSISIGILCAETKFSPPTGILHLDILSGNLLSCLVSVTNFAHKAALWAMW